MSNKIIKWLRASSQLEIAIIISIAIGIGVAAILIVETKQERFSSLYLYPESYTNFPEGNITSFIFGVKSYEKVRMSYDLQVFISNKLIDNRHFELDPGEVREEKMILEIPTVEFPAKVKLELTSPYATYDAHYWLKKPEEPIVPVETIAVTPEFTPVPTITSRVWKNTSAPTPTSTPIISNFTSIKIDRGFGPKSINISRGGKIIWINNDFKERRLTLVSKEGLFTKQIDIYKRFEYIFENSGTFIFYLKEIPGVEGDVIVH